MKSHDHHDHGHDLNVKSVDRLSSTKVRLTVEFKGETLQEHEKMTARRYLSTAKIPGFRPGKAPLSMIRERYRDEIRKDVVSHLLEAGLQEAIEQTKFVPVNRPHIQVEELTFDDGSKPFVFQAEFEIQPEIALNKYKAIPLKAASLEVADVEVTDMLNSLRERLSQLEPSDATKPEKGTFAVIDIGFALTNHPDIKQDKKTFTVEVGEGKLIEELDNALLEMTVGEERKVIGKFPQDYDDKSLAGQEAAFDCKLVELKKKTLPELDDALAGQLKPDATLETLKADIRENILRSKKEEHEKTQRGEIVDYLIANNHFDVPSSMIDSQSHRLMQWMEEDMKKKGFSQNNLQLKPEEMESVRKRAEQMVRTSLLLKEVADKENITLDEKQLHGRIESIADQLKRPFQETEKLLSGRGMLDSIRDEILTDQVFDFLVKNSAPKSAG